MDFFAVEVLTWRGLATDYVLFILPLWNCTALFRVFGPYGQRGSVRPERRG
jgi:hypothetical protein